MSEKKHKVAYNACWGGFSLSKSAVLLARKLSGDDRWGDVAFEGETWKSGELCTLPDEHYGNNNHLDGIERHDPVLIEVIEILGEAASGDLANVQVYELEGSKYWIEDYDGMETVHTPENMEWTVL